MERLVRFRPWFIAAAAYNALWGAAVVVWPSLLMRLAGVQTPAVEPFVQCIGMIVGVYALGYALVAKDPVRFGPFVYVGLLGKVLGPVGFLLAAGEGRLPWSFGWVNVLNDLVWLPPFAVFALQVARFDAARDDSHPSL